MYCKASLVCIWLFWSVNQKQKNKKKKKKITSIAILTVTSSIVINDPTRDLLIIETKAGFFCFMVSKFEQQNKCPINVCKQWIQILCCFTMVNPTAFFRNYCSIVKCMHGKLFVCLLCRCICVKTTNKIMSRLIPCPCDTSPLWKISQLFWRTSWICDLFTSCCALGE